MKRDDIFVLCTGLCCIDIINSGEENKTMLGGTAANIASALAALGYQVDFLTAQYRGDSGKWLECAMRRRGIHPLYFAETKYSSPKIMETLDTIGGEHIFRTKCPVCDESICKLVLPSSSQIDKIKYSFDKCYNLVVYDRISDGIKKIAKENTRGWRFYEPNSARIYSNFLECAKTADMLKISKEHFPDSYESRLLEDLRNTEIKLIIVSLGENGLKISIRNHKDELSDWIYIASMPVQKLVDSSGAGDWVTAVFLFLFLQQYPWRNNAIESPLILDCFQQAQEVARESCGYIGAQGMLCTTQGARYLKEKFDTPIEVCHDEKYIGIVCDNCANI